MVMKHVHTHLGGAARRSAKETGVSVGQIAWVAVILYLVFTFLPSSAVNAQPTGTISGKVVKSGNEPLIGANVFLVGTTIGMVTDLDGRFLLRNIAPGAYTLRFSFISYQTVTVDHVKVEAAKDTRLNMTLSANTIQMKEVTVTAKALANSELHIINQQKNSSNIMDGVSAELIRRNNSCDGAEVLKRMAGVTLSEGKYAYIRGIGDRYNNTLLNGSSLPSTDPEKKSFSYDMFPASLIENLFTAKTATPDKPADFAGGLTEIITIEFPSELILEASQTTAYDSRSNVTDYMTYHGGNLDWLAQDDGTRRLPSLISSTRVGRGNYMQSQLQSLGRAFTNNWQTEQATSPMNQNMKFSIGNTYSLGHSLLGCIGSFHYANSTEIRDLEKNNYTFEGPRYLYNGHNYSNAVSWSGMLNATLKLGSFHKLSLKNVYNQNADNETTSYEGTYYYNPDYRRITSLRYVSRSLFSTQLIGEHHLGVFKRLGVNWNINHGRSERDEPDARRYVYVKDLEEMDQPFRFLLDQSVSTRFFGNLQDNNRGAKIDITVKLFNNPTLPNLKTGFLYDRKNRQFDARTFGFRNLPGGNYIAEDQLMTSPVEQIFAAENFNDRFIEVTEITKPSDSYTSDQSVYASYLMTQFDPIPRIKVVAGVRYEKSAQTLKSYTLLNETVRVNPTYNDWLPSINIAYAATPKVNIRAAFSKTLARPEFREMAPFSYFDFLANELVQGNTQLKQSLITNSDLRLELYPGNLEMVSINGFYKSFRDPIEQILIAASGFEPIRSYANAKAAHNYGIEFELKKKLDSVAPLLRNFSFAGNLSLIHSEIKVHEVSGFQTAKRPLQGQADYISNFGLYFQNFSGRYAASLIYNKVGEKISRVGFANLGDIIELPRDQVDISASAKLAKHLTTKLAVKDLLNQDQKFIQRTTTGDKTAERWKIGRLISLGLAYSL
jgi:TonB-dependent receptor